jgi:hypothetical protein
MESNKIERARAWFYSQEFDFYTAYYLVAYAIS